MKKNLVILVIFILVSSELKAQKSTIVGLSFTAETSGNHFRPGFGATIEHKFTRKSGIESGLYYRNYTQTNVYLMWNNANTQLVPYTVIIAEKFLSVPILYKFYSRLVNVSAGMSFDFYTGFRHKNKSQQLTVNEYSIDPNMAIGVQVKMSKPIKLDDKLILEPELRLNPVITYNRSYAGIGITAKIQTEIIIYMHALFKTWETSRNNYLRFLEPFTLEQLNTIPDGFNNNIIWNVGHIIVAQQSLIYRLSGHPMQVSNEMFNLYKPGTKPERDITQEETDELKLLLTSLCEQTKKTSKKGIFTSFTGRMTATGFDLTTLDDALEFNNYHEGLHLGMMMSLRKLV